MFEGLKSFFSSKKGVHWLIPITTGLIGVTTGLVLMYLLPPYILETLNSTGIFTNQTGVTTARTRMDNITALGFLIVVISMIWIVIGVISSARKGK